MDLGERIVGCRAFGVEPETAGREEAEHQHDRFVVAQHQGREPVARAHAVAAADASLPLDRDAELLERRDVPAKRADVDLEPVRELPARRDRLRLQGLEEREQPRGWRGHLRK